jgi:SSS family solute:Na+ symporter
VLLRLGIADYTYGALLGAFLLGLMVSRASQRDAIVASSPPSSR